MSYNSLLINTCILEDRVEDKWGEPTVSVTTGVKCRWEFGNRVVRNFKGEEVLSTARVFFKKSQAIFETTRLRASPTDKWHGIQKIERPQDSKKIHHTQVYVD